MTIVRVKIMYINEDEGNKGNDNENEMKSYN